MTDADYARIQGILDGLLIAATEWQADMQARRAANEYAASADDDIVQALASIRERILPNILLEDRAFVMTTIKREHPGVWQHLQADPGEYTRAVAEIGRRERENRMGGK